MGWRRDDNRKGGEVSNVYQKRSYILKLGYAFREFFYVEIDGIELGVEGYIYSMGFCGGLVLGSLVVLDEVFRE